MHKFIAIAVAVASFAAGAAAAETVSIKTRSIVAEQFIVITKTEGAA